MPLRLFKAAACTTVVALAILAVSGTGCSGQGAGERCTFFPSSADADINGSDECQDGLKCYAGTQFPVSSGVFDRCCPLILSNPMNVPACYVPANVGGGQDAGPPDAPSDGPTDGSDAAQDAPAADSPPADAPADTHPADAKPSSDGPTAG